MLPSINRCVFHSTHPIPSHAQTLHNQKLLNSPPDVVSKQPSQSAFPVKPSTNNTSIHRLSRL